ncbi:MAG: hypothetical protein LBE84_02575, partial [Planctomycetota bacterium]|nr:hypothetical protein [Planctomycetota bacterium]
VRHPSSLSAAELKSVFIIVTTAFYDDIKRQLEEQGLIEFEHFAFWTFVVARPSHMLKKVIRTNPRPGPECRYAFSRLIVAVQGVFCCVCSPFITLPLGNILVQSCEEIWRSAVAKIFRLSIVNHTYCFCRLPFCNERDKEKPVRQQYGTADIAPAEVLQTVEFAFDCTCNLRCESCRDRAMHGNAGKIHEKIADSLLASPLVNAAESCQCCGGGEVFFGKGFEKLLFSDQAPVRREGVILTNLQLFSEEKWRKVREHFRRIRFLVSMDGATPETYERIRRGASFAVLMKNLRLVSALRQAREIETFTLNMVVQRKNFGEMPEMVKIADSLGADAMNFVKIMNWGTYSDRQYHDEISMFESDDETMMPELREAVHAILNSKHKASVAFAWQL